jgi:DNA-binding GntR family transcriptional regulator
MNADLTPIESTPSLQDQAYRAIKASIMSLALPPETQLSESDLAAQLHVSKTPVREALQRLERENLVRIVPRIGAFVTEISSQEIQEITEIRSVLIGLAAHLAAARVVDGDIQRVRRILEAGDLALQRGDAEEWLKLNEQFHTWLIDHADNQSLKSILTNLDERFERIQRLAVSMPGEIIESNSEHYDILEAIASRDPTRAAEAANHHIRSVGEQALKMISALEDQIALTPALV